MSVESGRGDPKRTLDLLWGRREPGSRGPKPGLSVDAIVRAAIAVADAEGLAAVSMRRVATDLGAGTMSLYRYVPGKGELVDLMLDAVFGEGVPPAPDVPWREALEHHAREGWAMYKRHPWAASAVTRPVLGPNALDSFESLLRVGASTGLAPGDVLNAVELVSGYVAGAAQRANAALEAERHTGVSDEEWWSARQSFWEDYFPTERYPTLTALWEAGAYETRSDAFEFGLQRVLDGLAAYLHG